MTTPPNPSDDAAVAPGPQPGLPESYQHALVETVAVLDIVTELISRSLDTSDIERILAKLDAAQGDAFTAKLGELLRRTSALLVVTSRLADSQSVDELLGQMVELMAAFVDAERCSIFLYDARSDELYARAAVGLGEVRFPAGQGIAGSVFRSGRSVQIDDAYADPRFSPEVDRRTGFRTRNLLCVPIRHLRDGKSAVVGVAQLLNKRRGAFAPGDMTLLETLNSQAATALVNAMLHEEIARTRSEERQMLEVTAALGSELQLQPLLLKIMETVSLILEADRATLFVHDAASDELWALATQGGRVSEIRFPASRGIAGHVFRTGDTINIPDAYADPRFNPEVDRQTGYRTQTILCMPVFDRQGRAIAVTQVLNKRGGPFTFIDERRLRAFSSQAAVAMENARLFDEVTRVSQYNESILESMSNGVITLGAAGTIVKVNAAAVRLLRLDEAGQAVGRHAADFFAGANAWIAESIDAVRGSGRPDVAMAVEMSVPRRLASVDPAAGQEVLSVNLSVVPLPDARQSGPGCMLMIEDLTQEKRLKTTMARYMTKEVVDRLLEEGEAALGGRELHATVLFTDIRGFTSIAEALGAHETVSLLNDYFSLMADVILERGGLVDKYIGDAILAVFGVPFGSPDDADHAVQAAIGMLSAVGEFNGAREALGLPPVLMGVGINSDEVVSGNIGSPRRMDYTVIGDGVNLASRLEGANKSYGSEILISEMTAAELKRPYALRELDRIRVKGRSQPVAVFEVLDHLAPEAPARDPRKLDAFARGLRAYRERDWAQAERDFEAALAVDPKDEASRLYLRRCAHLREHPPAPDWNGVWVMTEK